MVEQTQVQRVESILKRIRELKGEDEKAAKSSGIVLPPYLEVNPSTKARYAFIPVITSPRSK